MISSNSSTGSNWASATIPKDEVRLGWVSAPNQRGTIDILYASFIVFAVSVWTVLHPNIPSRSDSYWRMVRSKIIWAILGVSSPEMLTLFAVSQWNAARASVADMRELGVEDWTMVQVFEDVNLTLLLSRSAFYANSGGFFLEAPDCPAFPINAKSVHYLYSKGLIEFPRITREDIWDRSKADRFAKIVALTQAAWLLAQTIARAVQGLAITPLELFAVAFAVPTLATSFFLANKPKDVEHTTTIVMEKPIAEILLAAGKSAEQPWVDTPLDFVEKPFRERWERASPFRHFGGLQKRPIQRIPDDFVAPPNGRQSLIVWVVSTVHAAVHVAGWSFSFPTRAESIIWRVASLILLFFMFTGGVIPVISTEPWFDFEFTLLWVWVRKTNVQDPTWIRRYLLRRISDVTYALYTTARVLLFVEVFIAFRSLPASAYQTVNWSGFLPHIGR
ncbi:hypothetical protein F5Y12DRAFT_799684 [Xylaria sp. FL1777]|nr:hypothetical protein F5Y12DRAFT_799684 [Xylaria sp. FL1777]